MNSSSKRWSAAVGVLTLAGATVSPNAIQLPTQGASVTAATLQSAQGHP